MSKPLRILIVEDEALLAMELQCLVEDAGHEVAGWATSSAEAFGLAAEVEADLAFVDLHLADGLTGIDVAQHIQQKAGATVVFITANAKRLPEDFAGAAGVLAKPYSVHALEMTLAYLREGLMDPPPRSPRPPGFDLSPRYAGQWNVN